MKKYNRHEEDDHQAAFVEHFQKQYPKIFPLLFHIPNGGQRNILQAMRLKDAGVKPGVPDLFLALPLRGYHGMFIEMKSKNGRLSGDQKKMTALLRAQGFHVVVCHSSVDAMYESERYLKGYIDPLQPALFETQTTKEA